MQAQGKGMGMAETDRLERASRPGALRRETSACEVPAARVLAIDSDRGRRTWISSAFEAQQCHVAVWGVDTAEEFQCALVDAEFDVVVTELRLFWGHALDVLRAVRKRRVDVPVLLLTGDGDEACAAEAMRRGFADYLPRATTTPEKFVHHVRIALALAPRAGQARGIASRLEHESAPARRGARSGGDGVFADDRVAVSLALRRMAKRVSWEVCDAADQLLKVLDPDMVPFAMDVHARARMDEGRAAAERIASLVVGLMSYAAGWTEPARRTDVNQVLREVVERERAQAGRVQIAFLVDRAAGPVEVPPQVFERGVSTLLGMAVATAPPRGRVTVETSRATGCPIPLGGSRRPLPHAATEVTVTWAGGSPAVGAPLDLLEPLFPPPFPAPTGTLDIAVFHEAVRKAGGDVAIELFRGRPRVRIVLPVR